LIFWAELRRGVGQPEDSGGEDEDGAPQPEQRRVAAQEESHLPQQKLPPALQRIPDRRRGADRSRQESAGLAGQVVHAHCGATFNCENTKTELNS